MALDLFALPREFLAKDGLSCSHNKMSVLKLLSVKTYLKIFLDLLFSKDGWDRTTLAEFRESFSDSFAKTISCVFAILPEIETFSPMSDSRVGENKLI